ncbi:MAG: C40 family peptidase [Oscillospiraceae bacterium]
MTHTFVTATRCPLMGAPAPEAEQTDELLLGWRAEILEEPAPGWFKVRTNYRYEGFAPAACLSRDPDGVNFFAALPKRVVTRGFCAVLAQPKVQSWPVAELTRGALIAPLTAPDENGWVKAALPDGQTGYTKSGFLAPCHNAPPGEADFRQAVAETALGYLGAPYRWGGKSPLGIDCSGLAFMAYWLNGVTIFRDARMEPGFPVHEIPRSEMKEGDLLFFPGHVAVYLGDGRYVHSTARSGSDGVVINSLDPAAPDYREDLARGMTAVGSIF